MNGSFHQQQSFKLLEIPFCEGLESAISGERQAKLAKDKEVEVLHGVRFSQPLPGPE